MLFTVTSELTRLKNLYYYSLRRPKMRIVHSILITQ